MPHARSDLPSGTVTFLFTDVEGSTKLLHELGAEAYAEALAEHRKVIRAACASRDGVEVDTQGDAFFFAFPTAPGALAAAEEMTSVLAERLIQVRIGLHTGNPLLTDEGYIGDDVHFGARVAASGHGGQVVLSKATAELVELELADLGEHRLKDIEEAVAIYQLGEGSFPPLKTISNTNLPRPASSFVGRDAETAQVVSLLTEGARLVTLSGPGGTGKTRLAIEAAATLVPEYKAGVFWVGFATLRDPALVKETIAQTLGAKNGLATHIGERELLLLLDNLEQVIDSAPELSDLLSSCPNLTLLCTSRERLRISGEVEYAVPPLAESEAVELFCARTQLDADEMIAELCRRLDDMPLAVELAAARTKAMTPAQILDRLSQRLDLLKGGRDTDPRQQTLRATIEWSYELLLPEEQQLFARLSVFAGGCTLEAAEEVADADLDTLQSLVEKSLLRFTEARYWMLETIREYARERWWRGDEARLARAHARYYRELAEMSEPALWAQQTDVWLPRLDSEQANFRAALEWSLSEDAEAAICVAGALYPYWEIRARQKEARTWLERALAVDGPFPLELRAKALIAAGRVAGWHSDWSAASALLEEAVELCRRLGDTEGVGRCLGFIGHVRLFQGDVAGAAEALNEGVELARRTDDRQGLARALSNAAWSAIEERDFDRARLMWEEGAALSRAEGMKPGEALCVVHIGYAEALAGNFGRAIGHLDEGLVLFEDLGETTWTPVAQRYVGLVALLGGDIDAAEEQLLASLLLAREHAPQFHLVYWLEELAAVAAAKGDARRAATLWAATDAQYERLGMMIIEEGRQVRERYRREADDFSSDLGADAHTRGRSMTLQDAVSFALTTEFGEAAKLDSLD
jgi:predicted ATPase/class 3 adenylate cyclase